MRMRRRAPAARRCLVAEGRGGRLAASGVSAALDRSSAPAPAATRGRTARRRAGEESRIALIASPSTCVLASASPLPTRVSARARTAARRVVGIGEKPLAPRFGLSVVAQRLDSALLDRTDRFRVRRIVDPADAKAASRCPWSGLVVYQEEYPLPNVSPPASALSSPLSALIAIPGRCWRGLRRSCALLSADRCSWAARRVCRACLSTA